MSTSLQWLLAHLAVITPHKERLIIDRSLVNARGPHRRCNRPVDGPVLRLVDGDFPDYERVVPKNNEYQTTIEVAHVWFSDF